MKIIDSAVTAISLLKHPEKKETVERAKYLKGQYGLEIGGPSNFFGRKSYFPAYLYAGAIDGVNFNANTAWEGEIQAGNTYQYLKGYPKGIQYISEASELNEIENNKYDFLLSCHSLEHVANPIKALKRWNEVLKNNATLVLVLPNKEATFDLNRPYTTFDHLLEDYEKNVTENDNTHFAEILKLHLVEKDFGLKDREELEKRIANNFKYRYLHHHVFNFATIKQMLRFSGFEIDYQKQIHGINLFTLAKKV